MPARAQDPSEADDTEGGASGDELLDEAAVPVPAGVRGGRPRPGIAQGPASFPEGPNVEDSPWELEAARGRLPSEPSTPAAGEMASALRDKILALLDAHRIMTVATLRPDGWPQATTVGYVNEGMTLWFLCGLESQKARNLARDDRVSLTVDHDTADMMAITGLSMAARAHRVTDRAEAEKVIRMLPLKYPDAPASAAGMKMPGPDEVALFRVEPEVVSVLDYRKGFGHTDLLDCRCA